MANSHDSTRALDDWSAMSRKYWDAWNDATHKAFDGTGASAATNTPWLEGLEQWSRMFAQQPSQSETMERLLNGAKSYFSLLQSLAENPMAEGNLDPQAWTDKLRGAFNFPGADAALLDNPLARAMREIAGQGAKGFEQMMEHLAPLTRQAQTWLKMPAFGLMRERQEHYQKFAQAMLDYQEHNNRYAVLIARASRGAFKVFEDKLAERGEPGRQVQSVRALYDLWVDAAEEAYAEVALSPEFREVYGAMVNSQMRVRQHVQQEVERVAIDLGMPTRTEINSMGKRLHEARRELKRRDEADATIAAELAALRSEIEKLKQPSTRATAPKQRQAKRPAKSAAAKSASKQQAKRPAKSAAKKSAKSRKG